MVRVTVGGITFYRIDPATRIGTDWNSKEAKIPDFDPSRFRALGVQHPTAGQAENSAFSGLSYRLVSIWNPAPRAS